MNTHATTTFGIEIEMTAPHHRMIAELMYQVLGDSLEHVERGLAFDLWHLHAADERVWSVEPDASLGIDREQQAEIVSPILTKRDIPTLRKLARLLQTSGLEINGNCAIHIHLGADAFDLPAILRLIDYVREHEARIEAGLGVTPERRARYCQSLDENFLARLDAHTPTTFDELNTAWYGSFTPSPDRYDETRYHGLNLNALWTHGPPRFGGIGIELRWFPATLDADRLTFFIQTTLGPQPPCGVVAERALQPERSATTKCAA